MILDLDNLNLLPLSSFDYTKLILFILTLGLVITGATLWHSGLNLRSTPAELLKE